MALSNLRFERQSAGILGRLFAKPQTSLKELLGSYPTYKPPYTAVSCTLTPQEAVENFEHFQLHKSERIKHIQDLLNRFALAFEPQDVSAELLNALDGWAYQQWPSILEKSVAETRFSHFQFNGLELAIRSMLFDLSTFLGECYRSIEKRAIWTLENSKEAKAKALPAFQRAVIVLDSVETNERNAGKPKYIDIEAHVYYHYKSQSRNRAFLEVDWKTGKILGEPVKEALSHNGDA